MARKSHTHGRITGTVRDLGSRLADRGLALRWLPVNQAYVVTFGFDLEAPILKGPAPAQDIADWYCATFHPEPERASA